MADQILPDIPPVLTSDLQAAAGGRVQFYETGTTTLATVYTNQDGTDVLANSVAYIDSAGRLPQIFATQDVRAVIYDEVGAIIRVVDPCPRLTASGFGADSVSINPIPEMDALTAQDAFENLDARLNLAGDFGQEMFEADTPGQGRNLLQLQAGALAVTGDQPIWNAGSNAGERIISPLKLHTKIQNFVQNFTNNSDIGYGQEWQDLTASRDGSTVYTNDTGRPIMVGVRGKTVGESGHPGDLQVRPPGGDWVTVAHLNHTNSNNSFVFGYAIVPPGHQYRISGSAGSVAAWSELR